MPDKDIGIGEEKPQAMWTTAFKAGGTGLPTRRGDDPLMDSYLDWKGQPDTPANPSLVPLMQHLDGTIESALQSYAGEHKDSYRTRARIMTLDAIRNYDPAKGARLTSHVYNNLKSLNRLKADRSNMVHIPEGLLLDRRRLEVERSNIRSETGRDPTVEDLSDRLHITPKRISQIESTGKQTSSSQFLSEKGDSLFQKKEDPQRIWSEYVYHDMDHTDKKIFEWSTGYMSQPILKKQEIAARLGISPAAVSQRINKIVARLEEGYNVG